MDYFHQETARYLRQNFFFRQKIEMANCQDCQKPVRTLRADGTPWPRCWGCSEVYRSSLPRCIDCVKPLNPAKNGVVYERCYNCSLVHRGAFQKCIACDKPMAPSKTGKIYLRCYTCGLAKTATPFATLEQFLETED